LKSWAQTLGANIKDVQDQLKSEELKSKLHDAIIENKVVRLFLK
jgi:hypothetical protein